MKQEVAISEIVVGDRVRKDMGDIRSLASAMEISGQLQPIGIDRENNLIFGHRRLLAAMSLDWATIWAEQFESLDTAVSKMIAERDENTEHKPFTPSEAVAMGRIIESLEKPKAQERKAATQLAGKREDGAPIVGASNLDAPKGRTDEKVAAAVGMSKDTYRKAKAVVEAAEKPDAPPEAIEAAAEMDRTGKVDPAYRKIKSEPLFMEMPRKRQQKPDGPQFVMSVAEQELESAILLNVRVWPQWAKQEVPTILRRIAKGMSNG